MKEEKTSAHIEPSKDLSVARERSHFTDLLDFAKDQESHELVTMGAAKIPALGVTFFKYSFPVSSKTHRSSFFGEISEAFKTIFRESSPT